MSGRGEIQKQGRAQLSLHKTCQPISPNPVHKHYISGGGKKKKKEKGRKIKKQQGITGNIYKLFSCLPGPKGDTWAITSRAALL